MNLRSLALAALILVHAEGEPFADWMASLQRPDASGSCCGPSDQFYVDDYSADLDGDGFVARVGGNAEIIRIPANKVIWDRVNPTGRGVLFKVTTEHGGEGFVYCFVPGSGA